MARIVTSLIPPETVTVNSATVIPSQIHPYVAGDLLFFCLTQDGGSTAINPDTASYNAGWRIIGTQASSGGSRQVWAVKRMESSSETPPTFTGSADTWVIVCVVVRDASTTDFIHGSARKDWNNVQEVEGPSLTTTADNCLILVSWGTDNVSSMLLNPPSDASFLATASAGGERAIVGWKNQYAAGAVTPTNMLHNIATEGGNGWVIAIANAENGSMAPEMVDWYTPVRSYIGTSQQGSFQAPDSISGLSSIGGIPMHSAINASSAVFNGVTITSAESLAANSFVGGFDALPATVNLEQSPVSLQFACSVSPISSRIGKIGFLVVFVDTSNNWVAFSVPYFKLEPLDVITTLHFDISVTPDYSGGLINAALIDRIGFFYERVGGQTGSFSITVSRVLRHGTATLVGGGIGAPANVVNLYTPLESWNTEGLQGLQGSSQLLQKQTIKLGNGTNKTVLNLNGNSIDTPPPYDLRAQSTWRVGFNKSNIEINASANDTIILSNCVFGATQQSILSINSNSSLSAEYDFTGMVVIGRSVMWKTGIACAKAPFSKCTEIDGKAAHFTDCIISTSTGTHALALDAGGSVAGSSFTKGADTYALNLREAGAYNLSGATFSGYTTPVHVTAVSGTVTITLADGQSAPAYVSDGATVVIAEAVTALTISAQVSLVGAEVRLYDLDTSDGTFGTELSGVESCTTATYSYTGLRGNVIAIQIMLDGFVEYMQTITLENPTQNLNITLAVDTNA